MLNTLVSDASSSLGGVHELHLVIGGINEGGGASSGGISRLVDISILSALHLS